MLVSLLASSASGCNWLARYSSGPAAEAGLSRDATRDAPVDAPGDARADARDAADLALDMQGSADGASDSVCGLGSEGVFAHYRFDDPTDGGLLNSTPQMINGGIIKPFDGGLVRTVDGRCGGALAFDPTDAGYAFGYLAPAAVWRLKRGSIDFWIRIPPAFADRELGILSRDEFGQVQGGHLTVRHYRPTDAGPRMTMRLQVGNTTQAHTSCGPSIADGAWHHVGINFGDSATELTIDGVLQPSNTQNCAGTLPAKILGIDDNNLPWVIGAHTVQLQDGGFMPRAPLHGVIDELRFSNVRRDFSGFAGGR
ncbi:MAG: hypothetical protein KC503_03290 [Myxococcales bacterium]|nr:hypothetical protein [Myxococcales bacterium]